MHEQEAHSRPLMSSSSTPDFFISGALRNGPHGPSSGTSALTHTAHGWQQRVVVANDSYFTDTMKKDYMCNETEEELLEWIRADFKSWKRHEKRHDLHKTTED